MASIWFVTNNIDYNLQTETATTTYEIEVKKDGTIVRHMNGTVVETFPAQSKAAKRLENVFETHRPKILEMWRVRHQITELTGRWRKLREDVGDNTNVKG